MPEKRKYNYGGQAVIEGVMIRGRTSVVTAVRKPNSEIIIDNKPLPSMTGKWRRTPLIRGVVILAEAMVIGIKSLMFSANVVVGEESGEEIPTKAIWGMLAIAAVLVIALFFLAPLFLTRLMDNVIPNITANSFLFHIIEGVVRIGIFVGYLKVISMMKDVKRVFTYHGAEHKTVNAYEAGVPMEPEAIKVYSKAHVRCGTSFLFLVLIVAIVVFTFVGRPNFWIMIAARIVGIPVIMGIGYEIIYFGARHTHNPLMKIILAPGLWMQALTTGEPDDRQLEVAITAMKKAVEIDEAEEAAKSSAAG